MLCPHPSFLCFCFCWHMIDNVCVCVCCRSIAARSSATVSVQEGNQHDGYPPQPTHQPAAGLNTVSPRCENPVLTSLVSHIWSHRHTLVDHSWSDTSTDLSGLLRKFSAHCRTWSAPTWKLSVAEDAPAIPRLQPCRLFSVRPNDDVNTSASDCGPAPLQGCVHAYAKHS